MKNRKDDVDIMLRRALESTEKPDPELIEKVKAELMKEESNMKKSVFARHSLTAVLTAAVVFILIATTVLAAWHYLKPSRIAEEFEDKALSAAFESDTAININSSVTSGEYIFTLLAVVTGKDISDMPYYSDSVQDERTYAVVAIQYADGSPIPGPQDEKYLNTSFFATPLVKGLAPWQVNAASMNGGYSEMIVDGILYRIVECDSVAVFADRGLYFAICTDTFINNTTFLYDEQSGEIAVNPDYQGASALFPLPIDKSLADPEKASQYLKILFTPSSGDDSDIADFDDGIDWDQAKVVPGTEKTLTVKTDGSIEFSYNFEHGSGNVIVLYENHFSDNKTAQTSISHTMQSDDVTFAIRLSQDENGVITGAVVMPE